MSAFAETYTQFSLDGISTGINSGQINLTKITKIGYVFRSFKLQKKQIEIPCKQFNKNS